MHMKNLLNRFRYGIIMIVCVFIFLPVWAQVHQAPSAHQDVRYTVENDVQISPTELQFDIYLKDTDPAQPFVLSMVQGGFYVSTSIVGGGTITCSVVQGYSELVEEQRPYAASYQALDASNFLFKLAVSIKDSIWYYCERASIISTDGLGTRVARLSIVNSIPFPANSQANIRFCLDHSGFPYYAAKVFEFETLTPCHSVEVPLDTTNSYQGATYMNLYMTGPTGINDNSFSCINIYSAGKNIFIDNPNQVSQELITVYNLVGQEVLSQKPGNPSAKHITVQADLPEGYYIVKAQNEQAVKVAKIYLR